MLTPSYKKIISVILIITFSSYGVLFALAQKTYADLIGDPTKLVSDMAGGAAQIYMAPDSTVDNPIAAGYTKILLINGTGLPVSDFAAQQKLNLIAATMMGVDPITGQKPLAPPGTAKHDDWWNKIATFVIKMILHQFTMATVNWINSGFQGNPAYIQDPGKFLEQTADRTIGEFIFRGPLNWLCDPFKVRIQLSLGFQYRPFQDKINCTLSGIMKNINGAYKDFTAGNFINGGGWNSWLQMTTQPQNNEIGAMLMAQSELDARIEASKDVQIAEAGWGSGLLSFKKCTDVTKETFKDANGNIQEGPTTKGDTYYGSMLYKNNNSTSSTAAEADGTGSYGFAGTGSIQKTTTTNCTTETPGSATQALLQKTTTMDLDQLGVANDINEIVSALANYSLKQIMTKTGFSGVSSNVDTSKSGWEQQLAQLNNYSGSASDYASYSGSASNSGTSGGGSGTSANNSANSNLSTQDYLAQYYAAQRTPNQTLSARIDGLIASESFYNNSYNDINTTLSSAKNEFASSSVCNYNFHEDLRALTLGNVVKNIAGTNTSSEVVNNTHNSPLLIPTNMVKAEQEMASSSAITDRLAAVQAAVSTYTAAEIATANAQLTAYPFHSTSTIATTKSDLKSWFDGISASYTTANCPIDTSVWNQ